MVSAGNNGFAPRAVRILMAAALLLNAAFACAELSSSVSITGYTSMLYSGNLQDPLEAAALLESSLYLDSTGNKNVKAYLQLDAWITDSVGLDVPRAYLKVRFPWFRLTVGKTRLSWGDGFVFNAGDVLFGSMGSISGGLSDDTLRAETGWLTALYLPLGAFSYLEAVAAPYGLPAIPGSLETDLQFLSDTIAFDELSAGARGVFKLDRLNTTMEAGYYADGIAAEHRPYLSLHGHLLVDWNLSASMSIPMGDPAWQQWDDWLAVSAGVFQLWNLGASRTLSLRLEAAIRPGSLWREAVGGEAIHAGLPDAPVYGLYLFPEIAFAPSDTLSVQLRSFFSPVDLSAVILAGVSWNVYQGLDVFSYLTVMGGDADDLYGLDRSGGVGWATGLEFVY